MTASSSRARLELFPWDTAAGVTRARADWRCMTVVDDLLELGTEVSAVDNGKETTHTVCRRLVGVMRRLGGGIGQAFRMLNGGMMLSGGNG